MKRPRVLLADDHADVAEQLRSILEAEFDVVAVVPDGSALLAAAGELAPDVIVTDIAMPVMDGLAATAALIDRAPDVRVVLISVHNEPSVRRRGLAAGALGYVHKFMADHDLLPAVRAVLQGQRFDGGCAQGM
jgi:DNA-binding NarL/FixJ family response regulator